MSKCEQCKIEVMDNTEVCPLCGAVLEKDDTSVNRYPDVRPKTRKLRLIVNIYLFLAIVIEALLIYLNYNNFHGVYWSAITLAALAYGYFTLAVSVLNNMGYKAKLIWQTLFGILFVILIDLVVGYRGWSVNYVLPGGILLLDAGIIALMCYNARNWQSYILFEMFVLLCSLVPLLLILLGIITKPLLSIVALAASVFLFLGTVIIGDRKARVELKRRFHVR